MVSIYEVLQFISRDKNQGKDLNQMTDEFSRYFRIDKQTLKMEIATKLCILSRRQHIIRKGERRHYKYYISEHAKRLIDKHGSAFNFLGAKIMRKQRKRPWLQRERPGHFYANVGGEVDYV